MIIFVIRIFKKYEKAVITSYFTRTDCLQYRKYEHGAFTGSLKSLKDYSEQLKDMVAFYLGCSSSFEKVLQAAGIPVRNVDQKCSVSMYKVRMHRHNLCYNLFIICPYLFYVPTLITQKFFNSAQ